MYNLLVAIVFCAAGTFILSYRFFDAAALQLALGDTTQEAIFAPRPISYVSDIITQERREEAIAGVPVTYTTPDPKVAREQVNRLRDIFAYLDSVRADPYGSLAEKSEWIAAIPDLTLTDLVVDQILILNEQAWEATKLEALAILDQTMRAEIREGQLLATRRQLNTRVALDTPDEQVNVIVAITEDLIRANTFPDEVRTQAERDIAADAVQPVTISYEENELIIPAGRVIGPLEMEALAELNLFQRQFQVLTDLVAPAFLMFVTTVVIGIYLTQYSFRTLYDHKRLTILAGLILAFLIIAKLTLPNLPVIAYLYPIAAMSMMIVILIDVQLAFILTVVVAYLIRYIAPGDPAGLTVFLILSGWAGVLSMGRGQRVNGVLLAAVYVSLINIATIIVFNVGTEMADTNTSLTILMVEGVLNGVLSSGVALLGVFAIGHLAGFTTSIQLMDLSRPTHPLLRQLLLKAPGTYHHSLMVSNLSEQAAERIGANALMVRVMAYYHDVGKMQRPYFFIENQPTGANVHEKLDPQISAQIIISHVKDGLDLANKYRLPPAIKAGIMQHQGTGLVKYFYYQALQNAQGTNTVVKEADFRYPGPRPQTKENGILMLADVSESTVRALKPSSADEIDEIVRKVIADKLNSGELDECDLTIADLHRIRTAFVDILQGVHHPRIKYPEQANAEEAKADDAQAQPATESPTEADKSDTNSTAPKPEPQARPMSLVRRE